jgi:hypothetical protein
MTLKTSESLNPKSPSKSPFSSPPALAKFAIRPVRSHFWKSYRTVTVRFVSSRGDQKPSATVTAVKGTGRIG